MITLYVGTMVKEGPETLFAFQFDEKTGSLERSAAVDGGPNPAFLALHPNGQFLYAVNETSDGQASAFFIDPESGIPHLLNRQAVGADGPCYVSLDRSANWLLVANYPSGRLSVLPVNDDGALGEVAQVIEHVGSAAQVKQPLVSRDLTQSGKILMEVANHQTLSSVMADRQEKAHAHSIRPAPGGKYLLAADLGMDLVWVYDFSDGRLVPAGSGRMHPGAGPRHLEFHQGGRVVYVANELDSTVTACEWDGFTGELKPVQTLSTLPEGWTEDNSVADIHRTPDGRFLYVSNRGHNSLALFVLDEATGQMKPGGHFSTIGDWPRNFAIDPSGRYLLVANQRSSSITVFQSDSQSGRLTAVGSPVDVPAPVCLVFL